MTVVDRSRFNEAEDNMLRRRLLPVPIPGTDMWLPPNRAVELVEDITGWSCVELVTSRSVHSKFGWRFVDERTNKVLDGLEMARIIGYAYTNAGGSFEGTLAKINMAAKSYLSEYKVPIDRDFVGAFISKENPIPRQL